MARLGLGECRVQHLNIISANILADTGETKISERCKIISVPDHQYLLLFQWRFSKYMDSGFSVRSEKGGCQRNTGRRKLLCTIVGLVRDAIWDSLGLRFLKKWSCQSTTPAPFFQCLLEPRNIKFAYRYNIHIPGGSTRNTLSTTKKKKKQRKKVDRLVYFHKPIKMD